MTETEAREIMAALDGAVEMGYSKAEIARQIGCSSRALMGIIETLKDPKRRVNARSANILKLQDWLNRHGQTRELRDAPESYGNPLYMPLNVARTPSASQGILNPLANVPTGKRTEVAAAIKRHASDVPLQIVSSQLLRARRLALSMEPSDWDMAVEINEQAFESFSLLRHALREMEEAVNQVAPGTFPKNE